MTRILIISPEPWGINFVSKHHYAMTLARQGYEVFFLNPPSTRFKKHVDESGVNVVDYKPRIRGLNRLPLWARKKLMARDISMINKFLGVIDWDLIWTFDPFRFQDLSLFATKHTIYHCVDLHRTNLEKNLTEGADLVLTTSERLKKRLGQYRDLRNIHNLGHGLAQHFEAHQPVPAIATKIKVGLVGNVLYPFLDTSCLVKILEDNPSIEFHFIGPKGQNLGAGESTWYQDVEDWENVFFHGARKSYELPELFDDFQLFLICYDTQKFKEHLDNPHKILEYLSTGKVTVSHYIDEYQSLEGLVMMAQENRHLPELFRKVIGDLMQFNSDVLRHRRREFACSQTYVSKIDHIFQLLESAHS